MYDVFIYDMNTKVTEKFGIDYPVSDIQVEKGRILAHEMHLEASNYRFDVLTEQGESIFSDEAVTAFIRNGNVYYCKIFNAGSDFTEEYYVYNLTGKTTKQISRSVYQKQENKYYKNRFAETV